MANITVEERTDDWIAFLNDDRKVWETGKTSGEAIGKLVFYRQKELGIKLKFL